MKSNIVPPAGGCVSHGHWFCGDGINHAYIPVRSVRGLQNCVLYVAVDKHSILPEVQHGGNSELSQKLRICSGCTKHLQKPEVCL